MTPEQHTELLVRLDERTEELCGKMDYFFSKADNGGWSRCKLNMAEIAELKRESKERDEQARWYRRAAGGAIVVLMVNSFFGPIVALFQKLLSAIIPG